MPVDLSGDFVDLEIIGMKHRQVATMHPCDPREGAVGVKGDEQLVTTAVVVETHAAMNVLRTKRRFTAVGAAQRTSRRTVAVRDVDVGAPVGAGQVSKVD